MRRILKRATDRLSTHAQSLTILLRITVVLLGGVHTVAAMVSQSMNPDGVSYLDMGDYFYRGDWQTAINSYWSPLYSWILGLVMNILKPGMRYEFPVVHLVNFGIFLLALVCFEYLWRQLWLYQQADIRDNKGGRQVTLPEWGWLGLGYLLFLFTSLSLISIWSVTPDMLMSAFVYLAAGLVVHMRTGVRNFRPFILLGIVLGLSYLAKAIMFPIALVFIAVSVFSGGNPRRDLTGGFTALVFFFVFSLPFVAILSFTEGRFTVGEAGKLTYVKYLNEVDYPHWQGNPPGNGTPTHPSRLIFDQPPIYEFGSPVGGTYPISFNPAYWYQGVTVRLDLERQLYYVLYSAIYYFDLFFRQLAGLVVGIILLYLMGRKSPLGVVDAISRWGLIIPAILVFTFYGLVHLTGRYIGMFVLLFWSDLLANVRLPENQFSRRLLSPLSSVMILFMVVNILIFNLEGLRDLSGKGDPHLATVQQAWRSPSWPGEVAQELHRLGIQPGDKVAIIGYGFDAFWARLARVRIIAEMLDSDAEDFWVGDAQLQLEVIKAFAGTGAEAIVAEYVPGYARLEGWHQIKDTNYFIFLPSP